MSLFSALRYALRHAHLIDLLLRLWLFEFFYHERQIHGVISSSSSFIISATGLLYFDIIFHIRRHYRHCLLPLMPAVSARHRYYAHLRRYAYRHLRH